MTLEFTYTPDFKKDIRRAAFQGRDIMKLFSAILLLLDNKPLPPQYHDHPLKGEWQGHREFHIEPDWLVIYRKMGTSLVLEHTGTHSDLFKL
jgi:mRNA interferase YafQ